MARLPRLGPALKRIGKRAGLLLSKSSHPPVMRPPITRADITKSELTLKTLSPGRYGEDVSEIKLVTPQFTIYSKSFQPEPGCNLVNGLAEIMHRILSLVKLPKDMHLNVRLAGIYNSSIDLRDLRNVEIRVSPLLIEEEVETTGLSKEEEHQIGVRKYLGYYADRIDAEKLILNLSHEIAHAIRKANWLLSLFEKVTKRIGPIKRWEELKTDDLSARIIYQMGFDDAAGLIERSFPNLDDWVVIENPQEPSWRTKISKWYTESHPSKSSRVARVRQEMPKIAKANLPRYKPLTFSEYANVWEMK